MKSSWWHLYHCSQASNHPRRTKFPPHSSERPLIGHHSRKATGWLHERSHKIFHIHPTVEFVWITPPFDQDSILRSLEYFVHSIHVVRLCHFLQFLWIKSALQHFPRVIRQHECGRLCTLSFHDSEDLFCPLRQISLLECPSCLADPHCVSNMEGRFFIGYGVGIESQPDACFISGSDVIRCHSDTAVWGAVVDINHRVQYSHIGQRVMTSEITPQLGFSVLLKRSTMEALMSSFSVVKWWTLWAFNHCWNLRLRNSVPLSVCNFFGRECWIDSKASTRDVAILSLRGTTQAFLENTSIHVRRNLIPPLCRLSLDTSIRSACHCWFGPPTMVFLRGNL